MSSLGAQEIILIIVSALIWALIILAVIRAARLATAKARRVGEAGSSATQETPLDILKRRYARGEITREQYQEMRRDLEG